MIPEICLILLTISELLLLLDNNIALSDSTGMTTCPLQYSANPSTCSAMPYKGYTPQTNYKTNMEFDLKDPVLFQVKSLLFQLGLVRTKAISVQVQMNLPTEVKLVKHEVIDLGTYRAMSPCPFDPQKF